MTVYANSSDEDLPGLTSVFDTVGGSVAGPCVYAWPEGASRFGEMGGMTGDDLIRLAERELHNDESPPRPS